MVSVDKRIWNRLLQLVHLVLMFQHFPLYIPGLTLSCGGSRILLYWISVQACLQSACIPASHLSRHKHACIHTNLSAVWARFVADWVTWPVWHRLACQRASTCRERVQSFIWTLFNDIDKHTEGSTVYCPGGRKHQRLSVLLLSHIHPLFIFSLSLSLEMQNTAKHASLQFNPCLKPPVLWYYWCVNW